MAYFFVNEAYVKTATTVSANVDAKSIYPHLAPASDMFIKKILKQSDGSNWYYEYLLSAYTTQTLTTDEITLVSYIRPALAWRVATMASSALFSQITNKGPQLQSGDNSSSVDNSALYYLVNSLEKNAEFYAQELVEYLRLNYSLYPLYTGSYCNGALTDQFDSGVASYRDSICYCGRVYGYCTCGRFYYNS